MATSTIWNSGQARRLLSSLRRASARRDGQSIRSPHVRVCVIGTKTARIKARRNTTSRRRGPGASRSGLCRALKSVGPNATLVEDDIETVIRGLKAQPVGEIDVAGPELAGSVTNLGFIDEYRLYPPPHRTWSRQAILLPPSALPGSRLVTSDLVSEDVIRLDVRSRLISATRPTDCAGASGPLWVIKVEKQALRIERARIRG